MKDFETRHVVRILEIKSKTLIDWVEIGLVIPDVSGAEGAGTRRRYSEHNLVEFAIVKVLLGDGLKRELVRHALAFAREYARPDPLIYIAPGTESPFSLSTKIEEGASFFLLFDLAKGRMKFGLVPHAGTPSPSTSGDGRPVLASADEIFAALGKDMVAMGRAYWLNVSALKVDIRARLAA